MNVLCREKQIEVIATLCEGVGIRTASRLTGANRGTVASLALRVGMGCMELHDRIMVGIRTERLELDEMWSFVGKKQKNVKRHEIAAKGQPEISTDGFHPHRLAIWQAFGNNASHGIINKTYSVTNLTKDAATRYCPAAVVAVKREVVSGDPDQYVSTSYVERQNLSLRMASRRFTRLTNGLARSWIPRCCGRAVRGALQSLPRS